MSTSVPPAPRRVLTVVATALLAIAAGLGGLAPSAAAEESVGHLPTAEDFVTQQYEDFLGRAPDDGGLAYWSDLVRDGVEPSALVESMATSAEFEGVIAPWSGSTSPSSAVLRTTTA